MSRFGTSAWLRERLLADPSDYRFIIRCMPRKRGSGWVPPDPEIHDKQGVDRLVLAIWGSGEVTKFCRALRDRKGSTKPLK